MNVGNKPFNILSYMIIGYYTHAYFRETHDYGFLQMTEIQCFRAFLHYFLH